MKLQTKPFSRFHLLASLLSAGLFTLSMPGWDMNVLAVFALVPWGICSLLADKRNVLIDWFFFFAMLWGTVYWIGYVDWGGAALVITIESILMLPTGYLVRRLSQWVPATLALPLAWCAMEFLRIRYPWDGLPYSVLGFSQYKQTMLIQSADLFGVLGTSFLLAMINGLFIDLFTQEWKAKKRYAWGSMVCVVFLANLVYGMISAPRYSHSQEKVRVGCVQANIPSIPKQSQTNVQQNLRKYIDMSKQLMEQSLPDLLIWPENAFPFSLGDEVFWEVSGQGWAYTNQQATEQEADFINLLNKSGILGKSTAFLFACHYYRATQGKAQAHPTAVLFNPEGRRAGLYHKIHLVPGGEFLPNLGYLEEPLNQWLSLDHFRDMTGNFSPGKQVQVFSFPLNGSLVRFTPSLCYDNAFADIYIEATKRGADFHTVISSEAWYRKGEEADQLLAAAVFRAIETRRAVVRGTNSGISALITADGQIRETIVKDGQQKLVAGLMNVEVPISRETTLFVSLGEMPFFVFSLVCVFFPMLLGKRRNKH